MRLKDSLKMEASVRKFIEQSSFPCIMAKSLLRHGMLKVHSHVNIRNTLKNIYEFIDHYRNQPDRLSSFILCFDQKINFADFEKQFWMILRSLNEMDKELYKHDERVSSDIHSPEFSFSLKSEAFFILLLHPESPRWARRFSYPAIVFNPHQQFEKLRKNGIFTRIRNLIRLRDISLQGYVNPMLSDFGQRSEIYQYTGKTYLPHEMLTI